MGGANLKTGGKKPEGSSPGGHRPSLSRAGGEQGRLLSPWLPMSACSEVPWAAGPGNQGDNLALLSPFPRGQGIRELCCGWKRSARKWPEPTRTHTQLRGVNGRAGGSRVEGRGGAVGSAGAQITRASPATFISLSASSGKWAGIRTEGLLLRP